MDVRLLGNLEVEADGALLELGPPKQRAVLAVLVLNANEVVSTDRLIDLVWGDDPPRTAGHSVQLYISELRKVIDQPSASIETKPPGYLLRIDPDAIDVKRFARLVEEGAALADDGRHEAAAVRLRLGLELWRGPPLGDFAYDEFAQPLIRELEEVHLTAEVALAAAELELGHLWSAVPSLERIIAEHPLRERPVELYMLALYRQGRQAEALRAYDSARRRLGEELGIDPSPELRHLEEMVLRQDPSLLPGPTDRPAWSGNLPADITSFIGRVDELAELEDLVPHSRLVTLLGPGGVGKSRLAVELARRLAPDFADGAWLVELGTSVEPASIVEQIASLWPRPEGAPKATVGGLGDVLRDRRALLVLDNCERIVEGAAPVAEQLLAAAPSLHIVVTSREPLECRGEVLWRVGPLALAEAGSAPAAAAGSSEAVDLFVARAREATPGFTIDSGTAAMAARVCAMLEGMPLAIELAASRLRSLTLDELEGRLDDRLGVLVGTDRTAPLRQRTLQETIGWSYDLLDEPERELFRRLGDFRVEFPLRAVEVACSDASIPEDAIAPLVERLVDKSLVVRLERGGRTWYRLLDTIRSFGFKKYAASPGDSPGRGFLMHIAGRTDPGLLGSIDEMWSALLDGDADVAQQALTIAANRFREDEGGELAGVVAALVSKSRRVAFIAGVAPGESRPEADHGHPLYGVRAIMRRFWDGFFAGVRGRDPDIEIASSYLTDEVDFAAAFENPDAAGEHAAIAFADGADVIFHAAGVSGRRIFEIARRFTEDTGTHRWVIGVDFDEYLELEEHRRPHALTSVRKQVPIEVFRRVKRAVAEGNLDDAPWFNLENGGLALATSGGHIDRLAGELDSARREIIGRALS